MLRNLYRFQKICQTLLGYSSYIIDFKTYKKLHAHYPYKNMQGVILSCKNICIENKKR